MWGGMCEVVFEMCRRGELRRIPNPVHLIKLNEVECCRCPSSVSNRVAVYQGACSGVSCTIHDSTDHRSQPVTLVYRWSLHRRH